jgi:hypothetical protein
MKVAQHFSAGLRLKAAAVPKGRLNVYLARRNRPLLRTAGNCRGRGTSNERSLALVFIQPFDERPEQIDRYGQESRCVMLTRDFPHCLKITEL